MVVEHSSSRSLFWKPRTRFCDLEMASRVIYGKLAPPDFRQPPFSIDAHPACHGTDGFEGDALREVRERAVREGMLRDYELLEGRGERRDLPNDPFNTELALLPEEPYSPQVPAPPLEHIEVGCRGVVFDRVKGAVFSGNAFLATQSDNRVALGDNSESFLWLRTQANGDFAYSCGDERRVGNLQPQSTTPYQPDQTCFGRWCGNRNREHPWGSKDLLAQVTTSNTTGPTLRIRGIMACDAGMAPRFDGSGIPRACTPVAGFEDVYWPVRGLAQGRTRLRNLARGIHVEW